MYMCICICVYVYVYVYVYMYMYMCICICVYVYVYVYVCCLPVAKRKSIKKQGILKQPLSTPGVHKSVQIQVKNDEKIKHNGISHIL